MKTLARLAVLLLLFVCACVAASAASTARHPAAPSVAQIRAQTVSSGFIVLPFESRAARANAETGLLFLFPSSQPAPAKVSLFVPSGYGIDLAMPAGRKIADADAEVLVGATEATWSGSVIVDNAAAHAPEAIACTGTASHAAAWLLQVASGANGLSFTMFVDPAPAEQAALGAIRIEFCPPSPYVAPSAGGAAAGARVEDLFLDMTAGVTTPSGRGTTVWRALLTPYVLGTGSSNPGATVEVRSDVVLPQTLSLNARYDKKTKSSVVTGTLVVAGQRIPNVDVAIFASGKPSSGYKRVKTAKTNKKGTFSYRRKTSATTYFAASAVALFASPRCDPSSSVAPAGCVLETAAVVAYSRRVTVKPPKKK